MELLRLPMEDVISVSPSSSLELLSSSSVEVVPVTMVDCTNSLTTNRLSFRRY